MWQGKERKCDENKRWIGKKTVDFHNLVRAALTILPISAMLHAKKSEDASRLAGRLRFSFFAERLRHREKRV